ncbi:uncharacterized protein [Manis javanica]|uniref:uncharacterized protein n=1 Tax=Manis javanica TaxID=9974 RepID=UPI003C6D1924
MDWVPGGRGGTPAPPRISAAHSDCSRGAARPPIAAVGATAGEAARAEGGAAQGCAGSVSAPAWGRAAPGGLATRGSRPAADFQARNPASRAPSLALSPRRSLAAAAGAAAPRHTKDCRPRGRCSPSASSSGDGSPDSGARARRRRRRGDPSLRRRVAGRRREEPDRQRRPHAPRTLRWRRAPRRPGRPGPAAAAPAAPAAVRRGPGAGGGRGRRGGSRGARRVLLVPAQRGLGVGAGPARRGGGRGQGAPAAAAAGGPRRVGGGRGRGVGRRAPAARPGALGPPGPDALSAADGTTPSRSPGPAPGARRPADETPYLVKVHQVWAVKAGGLKKDSLLTVRLGAWRRPAFPSCGRLKEDSRYIFFMEPDANSSGRAPAAFRASFPPLETGRNLKKEVSRVLCKRCDHSNGSSNLKALSGSSGYKFGVLAKIVNYMKACISASPAPELLVLDLGCDRSKWLQKCPLF